MATTKRTKPASRLVQWYGWVPDLPDQRDKLYSAPQRVLRALPPKVDLRANCPPVYDQGSLGSCTANAIGAAMEFDQIQQKQDAFTPSRLFIYYNERAMERSIDEDSGAAIRDGVKCVAKLGAPPETSWPYTISKFRDKPPQPVFRQAAKYQALLYRRLLRKVEQLKGCLANGFPFVFGMSVYDSFESDAVAKTGKVPLPKKSEANIGGHAVLAVGYIEAQQRFIVRNSWGEDWGINGYFTIPYAYLLDENLADDFWTITLVEAK